MKKLLPLLFLLALPAQADVRHSIKSSATITLDPAYSSVTRIGSTYSVSGSNVTPSTTISGTTTSGAIGGLNVGSVTAGVPAFIDTDFSVTSAGSAFSAVESLTQGDAVQSATTVTAGVVGSLPSLGSTVTGWGISVGGNSNKKKKKEDEQMALGNTAGQQTIVIKQPIELITKQPTATRLNDLDRI